jgi:hypothetical protein
MSATGVFPVNGGPFRTLLPYQAHRLDPDFYKRFKKVCCQKAPVMATNDYLFITHSRVQGSQVDVYDLIVDVQSGLCRWQTMPGPRRVNAKIAKETRT